MTDEHAAVNEQELLDRAQARANLYALLALCFSEPTLKLAEDLAGGVLAAALRESAEALGLQVCADLEALESLGRPQGAAAGLHAELALEHMRLFVGPGALPCPPYESVCRIDVPADERGLLMGSTTVAVRQAYAAAGVDLAAEHHDLPDHISTELEFMYFLTAREVEARERGDVAGAEQWVERQHAFGVAHLGQWAAAFCDSVERHAQSLFYRSAASLLSHFIYSEGEAWSAGCAQ